MKKSIQIVFAVLITISLTAFGVINWKDLKTETSEDSINKELAVNIDSSFDAPIGPILKKDTIKTKPKVFEDFIYDVGTRFAPMKKSAIEKATSIEDFFTWEELRAIHTLKSVEIIIIENDKQTQKREIGYSNILTEEQLKLIKSFNYSTNFLIRIDFLEKNNVTDSLTHNYATPHLTIVPEKQAEYIAGKKALKKYLKENSKEARIKANVDPMKLQPAKLTFTVTKEGNIENARLDRTSNYPLVDKTMIELIKNLSGKWKPAENIKGEKTDQQQVVSFGLMGC